MTIIRDFELRSLSSGETKTINVTGQTIVYRRSVDTSQARIRAYAENSSELVCDVIIEAGEKITTAQRFKRLEVTNIDQFVHDYYITAGDGDFQSDLVEGEVFVRNSELTPLFVSTPADKPIAVSGVNPVMILGGRITLGIGEPERSTDPRTNPAYNKGANYIRIVYIPFNGAPSSFIGTVTITAGGTDYVIGEIGTRSFVAYDTLIDDFLLPDTLENLDVTKISMTKVGTANTADMRVYLMRA